MKRYRDLTPTEVAALAAYAAAMGRNWKDALREDWYHARLTGLLHSLRNTHGPSWLVTYVLPTAAHAARATALAEGLRAATGAVRVTVTDGPVVATSGD